MFLWREKGLKKSVRGLGDNLLDFTEVFKVEPKNHSKGHQVRQLSKKTEREECEKYFLFCLHDRQKDV